MGKTYSCDVEGCDKVFSRDYELRKHKVTHEDSNKLFYCEWSECDFYTLDPRNLDVHFATHTGKKIHYCPDTRKVLGPSGSSNLEERCNYSTNDPSLLTKHRKREHGYIPHPRAPSKNTGTFEIVFENIPSSRAKPKRVRKPKAAVQRAKSTIAASKIKDPGHAEDTVPNSPLPATPQQGAERANAESAAAPISLATHGQSADVESPHAAYDTGSTSSTAPVAPNQGDILFDPTTNFDWSVFYMEGSSSPSTIGTYNPSPNPEMNTSTMGSLGMYFHQDNSSGFGSWDESGWNNLWEKYNFYAR